MGNCSVVRLFGCLVAALGVASASPADEPPAQARVSFNSQPSGARIVLDGVERGTTPVTLPVAPGRHHFKYRLSGYADCDRFFSTSEGLYIEKNEELEEEKGLLLLKTDPVGCDVQVDGVSVGRTPLLLTTLSTKDAHVVKLRKAGYLEQKISVKFEGRIPQVREERLVLSSGTIDITSEPPGAEVTVNGIQKGKTPLQVTEVPKGRAVVKFHLDGFADVVRDLAINPGDVQTLPVVLEALPGTLHLVSVPEGARFYVNDEARGKGPLTIAGLKPGDYRVRAELEGYGTVSETVRLENGASARKEFRLSNVMGQLEVRTSPVGAEIVFDGRRVGSTRSGDPKAELSDYFAVPSALEGEHTLIVRMDGYKEERLHPKIQNSKTVQRTVRLKRVFVPDVEIVTARGTYRGVYVSGTPETVVIEVKLGITQSFPKSEIRKVNFIKKKQ